MQDITGQRFGRLLVIGYARKRGRNHLWSCACDCGNTHEAQAGNMRAGLTQSCGCLHRERTSAAKLRHGYKSNGVTRPEYRVWGAMIRRCYNPKDIGFGRYGGAGIAVCDAWRFGDGARSGFECFIADMKDRPSARHTIERLNGSLGYSPDNCVWATYTTQARNRGITKLVEWKGRTMPLAEACEIAGRDYSTVHQRLFTLHWPLDKALTHPVRQRQRTAKQP